MLGCLIEKQRTTPDAYPLSLNALRLACNQATNRDPVVVYDEDAIRGALARLGRRRFTRLASGHGSRASKYRHLLDEALGLAADEQAVLAVLLLRGAQTPGELKQRTERLQAFADLAALQEVLDRLGERGLVERLPRRPGQKEERYAHRLGEEALEVVAPAGASPPEPSLAAAPVAVARSAAQIGSGAVAGGGTVAAGPPDASSVRPREDGRLERLEREVAELRDNQRLEHLEREVAELRAELGALRAELGA